MGVYLNADSSSFEEAVNSEIYIDKTEMILFLNSVVKTKQKYVSVSRSRRFGNQWLWILFVHIMIAKMISAAYLKTANFA